MSSQGDAGADDLQVAKARRDELEVALARVRARVADACTSAGRPVEDVTLVVVTKTYPVGDLAALADLGVADVGEAREQELRDKRARLDVPGLRWHVVGRLQRNKARSVGRLAEVVHSVDDERLVGRLSDGAAESGRVVGCFVQLSLDQDPTRGGVPEDRLVALADAVAAAEHLRLLGVMAVAPMGADPDAAFTRLRQISAVLASRHPGATAVSAGMSGDLEQAVAHGATHLRVGAAVLGSRPALL